MMSNYSMYQYELYPSWDDWNQTQPMGEFPNDIDIDLFDSDPVQLTRSTSFFQAYMADPLYAMDSSDVVMKPADENSACFRYSELVQNPRIPQPSAPLHPGFHQIPSGYPVFPPMSQLDPLVAQSPQVQHGGARGDVGSSVEYQELLPCSSDMSQPLNRSPSQDHSTSSLQVTRKDQFSQVKVEPIELCSDTAGPSMEPQASLASKEPAVKGKPQRRRTRLPDKDSLICLICTDKASGRNFGALSCESCKAFFRRNAQKESIPQCVFEGDCQIDPHTRKFCSDCRLKKCIASGMTSDLILDNEARSRRKKCPKRNKGEGASNQMVPDTTEGHEPAASADTTSDPPVPLSPEDKAEIDLIINNHAVVDTALSPSDQMAMLESLPQEMQQLVRGLLSADNSTDMTPQQIAMKEQIMTMMGGNAAAITTNESTSVNQSTVNAKVLQEANDAIRVSSMAGEAHADMKRRELAESSTLQEVSKGRDYLINHDEYEALRKPPESNAGIFNMADGFIRRLVKFVRTLDRFKDLGIDCQTSLLKDGMMDLLAIRSAIQYNPVVDGFTLTDKEHGSTASFKMDFIKQQLGEEIYEKHMQFVNLLNNAASWDKPTMVLAMLINLFSSDRPNLDVSKKDEVETSAFHYTELLLKYLRSLYPSAKARTIHWRTLGALTNVRDYGHDSQVILQGINPERLGPLLREIFSENLASQPRTE